MRRAILLFDISIIVACVAVAALFLFLVTRASPAGFRRESNDFTGAVVAVIGTIYAVILAFMLAGVWNMFRLAQVNEEQEASALVNIFRIATQIPGADAKAIQDLCVRYVDNTVEREWPAMEKGQMTQEGGEMINRFWALAGQSANAVPGAIAPYQLMEELRGLTQYRRVRAMDAREGLPGILWAVLIMGGVITVAASCFFGVSSFRFHLMQVVVLTFLISLILVAISEIDQPYRGFVRVNPAGFSFAIRTLRNQPGP